ncbi:MAG: HAMP domain-containing histidine kinase [Clostridia bacterium]|nr:HAMP domain-containing histidine kinase [Clostridia bacterium]
MAIISRRRKTKKAGFSLRLKITIAFGALLLAALVVMNTYPAAVIKNQIINSSRSDMLSGVTTLASALESFPYLSAENISTAVTVLDMAQNHRVLVTDGGGIVLYDSQKSSRLSGNIVMFEEIVSALQSRDAFRCTYDESVFCSRAASPILKDGTITGVVYFMQNDTENALLLTQTRRNIRGISLAALIVSGIFVVFFNLALSRRFRTLLRGVDAVGKGDYSYRIEMRGLDDELSNIADEFNSMSSRLQKTDAVRRQFVSYASHELKTPLASIKLLSDSIIQVKDISSEDIREFVRDIGDEIDRLTHITESLLSLSRLDALPPVTLVSCDLSATVTKCAELLKGNAALYDVSINLGYEGEWFVMAARDGIFHIVFNLMENAVKYNKRGGRVDVRISRERSTTVLKISDTGIGIPQNELEKVFDRFYRVDKARSRETGGTGLGLSIAKEWVDNMGASIEIASTYGEGTEFTVRFASADEEVVE